MEISTSSSADGLISSTLSTTPSDAIGSTATRASTSPSLNGSVGVTLARSPAATRCTISASLPGSSTLDRS